ncbi:MAG: hypothetical protein HYX20_03285 [Candidatus Yanofskybacteria bacterium]|nr:hypothetical protein [Candidatus Yanofskybacteria bacterium]
MNKNKSRGLNRSITFSVVLSVVFSFVFVPVFGAYAASTIGTNMSTTGTFLVQPASDSTTSVRFQNAAGTNYFVANSTKGWIGVNGVPSTVFEVKGTASASWLMTANSLQVAGVASVAYSRFGIGATGHSLAATDDVLFAGLVEFDDNAFFDAKVSVSGNFQTSGRIRAGSASHSFTGDLLLTSNLTVGSTTASNSVYAAEFGSTATTSILFGDTTTPFLGTCFQLRDTAGTWVFARIIANAWVINTTSCR